MVDTCVCCGAIIPEGRHVCQNCENAEDNSGVLCPTCGTVLEVMNSSWYFTDDGIGCSTLFHCNACHNDWEKEAEYTAKPVKFTRKYWG